MRFVSDFSKSGIPEPREVEQASVRFHALSFIGSPYPYYNNIITTSRLREPIGNRESRNTKMEKKEKKIYQSPIMTVYEISRTQILAGSGQGETETLVEEEYRW
ncbi:hypothetical protein CIK89_06635 [Prevotella sp. P4-119]|nr:hypothetical protein CIK89_06635 [Prevotella sp. P4-119]